MSVMSATRSWPTAADVCSNRKDFPSAEAMICPNSSIDTTSGPATLMVMLASIVIADTVAAAASLTSIGLRRIPDLLERVTGRPLLIASISCGTSIDRF